MSDKDNVKDLIDAFDGHSITDENGQIAEETAIESSQPEEQTPIIESEEPSQEEPKKPEQETVETEPEEAEDEDGKKYVPKRRFDEVYAKWKEAERKAFVKQNIASPQIAQQPISSINTSTTAMLETELLNQALPQFRPFNSDGSPNPEYSEVLDEMGAEIYQSSHRYDPSTGQILPTITKLEAARRALDRAKKLNGFQEQARKEARIVKTQQSDSGITSSSKKVAEKRPEDMSLEEKEAYLKKIGQW